MAQFICFFGGDSQVGTTMLAASAAAALKKKGLKVLLLLASGEIDESYFKSEGKDMGKLLRIARPSAADVKDCISSGRDFDFIEGPRDLLQKQFFDPELISAVILHCSKDYDYILADAGHDATLPLSVSCLASAQRRFYVLDPGHKCTARFRQVKSVIIGGLGIDGSGDRLVLSKAGSKGGIYSLSDLCQAFSLEGFAVPAFADPYGREYSKTSAYGDDASYTKAVNAIAQEICGK